MRKYKFEIYHDKNNEMEFGGESFRDLIEEVEPEIPHQDLIDFAKFLNIPNPVEQVEKFILSKT